MLITGLRKAIEEVVFEQLFDTWRNPQAVSL